MMGVEESLTLRLKDPEPECPHAPEIIEALERRVEELVSRMESHRPAIDYQLVVWAQMCIDHIKQDLVLRNAGTLALAGDETLREVHATLATEQLELARPLPDECWYHLNTPPPLHEFGNTLIQGPSPDGQFLLFNGYDIDDQIHRIVTGRVVHTQKAIQQALIHHGDYMVWFTSGPYITDADTEERSLRTGGYQHMVGLLAVAVQELAWRKDLKQIAEQRARWNALNWDKV